MTTKNNVIPEGVKDVASYKQYKVIASLPIFTTAKTLSLSDGSEIALNQMAHWFKKKIAHLPIAEQEILIEKKNKYNALASKLGSLKSKAFGLNTSDRDAYLNDHSDLILDLLGRYFSYGEAAKVLQEDHGVEASVGMVERFSKKNIEEVKRRQEQFSATYTDVRLFVKRSRLEELLWLYNNRKDKYSSTGNREDYKLLLQTLEQIRKESEGDIVNVIGNLNVNVEHDIKNHLRQEAMKGMSVKEIILARVAAKQGLDVSKLIQSLNNSYYRRFDNAETVEFEETRYPSTEAYDFGAIERKNNMEAKDDMAFKPVIISDKAQQIKDRFLNKIKANQERMVGK